MRHAHRQSPFHRVECWTGSYFRRAALWEVGTYILVKHHTEISTCEGLNFQIEFLERLQRKVDEEEQDNISRRHAGGASASASASASAQPLDTDCEDDTEEQVEEDGMTDEEFFHWLDHCHDNPADGTEAFGPDEGVGGTDTATGHGGEGELQGFTSYLGSNSTRVITDADADAECTALPSVQRGRPVADALNNTYVRVVHTNGIHHLAMVTCFCHGETNVPLDLVAARLLPASLTRIKTIFTTPLMDYFRLCNLELKASAYQFYQLVCRLTMPTGNGEMVNLYHEFRRMSRLWRWMKKLKWAGYGHNQKDPYHPPPGSLANYCPTCPQPGINLPDDWTMDRNRFVIDLDVPPCQTDA